MVATRRGEGGMGEFPPVQDTQPMPVAVADIEDDTTDPDTRAMPEMENPFGDIPVRRDEILRTLLAALRREARSPERFVGRSTVERQKNSEDHFSSLSDLLTEYLVRCIQVDATLRATVIEANNAGTKEVRSPLPKLIKLVKDYAMEGVTQVAPNATEQIKEKIVTGIDAHIDRIITKAIQQINS